jgi:Fe-S cluster biogenesis protein NfuA
MTLTEKVEKAIDELRPYLHKDGGDVELVEITEDNVVMLQFTGACSSCNMSMMTLKSGIESAVKQYAPEIKSVEAVGVSV